MSSPKPHWHPGCPEWPPNWPEIDTAVKRVFQSGDWGRYHAEICGQFRASLLEKFGVLDLRLCCSGTAALEIALRAAQIGPGDRVVLAAYDYPGNFRTVELLGARPVLLDVSSESIAIDPEQLDALAREPDSEPIRAVIASHLYGTTANITRLKQICDDRQWILIEDACQAPGTKIGNQQAGSFGHFATLSFGGSKPLTAGGGGAVLVSCKKLAARLGGLCDRPGEVYPLSPVQAAVLEPQLNRLDEMNRLRGATVEFLRNQPGSQLSSWCWLSEPQENVRPAFYKVAWLAESIGHRDRIIQAARREQIPIGAGFRSTSRCSPRRCDKPVPTPRSDLMSDRLFVLDHRALMLKPEDYRFLAEALSRLGEAAASQA